MLFDPDDSCCSILLSGLLFDLYLQRIPGLFDCVSRTDVIVVSKYLTLSMMSSADMSLSYCLPPRADLPTWWDVYVFNVQTRASLWHKFHSKCKKFNRADRERVQYLSIGRDTIRYDRNERNESEAKRKSKEGISILSSGGLLNFESLVVKLR